MRAGSPDRYGRSIRNRKIAGSNPAQSTKHSAGEMLARFLIQIE